MKTLEIHELKKKLRHLLPGYEEVDIKEIEQVGNNQKPVYRIALGDGEIRKLRVLPSAMRATEVAQLSTFFSDGDSARVISVYGESILEEWIQGKEISNAPACREVYSAAGAILGRLHKETTVISRKSPSGSMWRLEQNLSHLIETSCITLEQRVAIRSLAEQYFPDSCDYGVTHRDLCGENLIQKPDGHIVLIDNASMRFGPLDQDIARTCHRWNPGAEQFELLLEAYSSYREVHGFKKSFFFWIVLVLSTSISWGLSSGVLDTSSVKQDLEILIKFLEKSEEGAIDPLACWFSLLENSQ